jgi:para-nitrobenzyl esterase
MNKLTGIIAYGFVTFALVFGGCNSVAKEDEKAVVPTSSGLVLGYVEDGVFAFQGMPYAQAERFMPPQEPDAWEGVRECKTFSPIAIVNNLFFNGHIELAT